ncbi:MAG: hypothetical protein Ct9H300mP27_12140 [Chloroflexota bacterium]|nr:MAG: hypothetical protein Ct9H300mP27_12140 [Chloroflexota bacterium]
MEELLADEGQISTLSMGDVKSPTIEEFQNWKPSSLNLKVEMGHMGQSHRRTAITPLLLQ